MHKELKKEYRKLESAKNVGNKLKEDYSKIPSPTRSEMISMLTQANVALRLGRTSAFTSVCMLIVLDGSEEYLVSDRIFHKVRL